MSVTFSAPSVALPGSSCSIGTGEGSTGPCSMLTDQERIDTGESGGGTAAGGEGCATGYLIGGFGDGTFCFTGGGSEKVAGFDAYSPFCYAHAICFHLANAYNARLTSTGMDAARNLDDDQTAFGIADGSFKGISFLGGKAGKVGSGLVIAPTGSDKGCVNINSQNISVYEVVRGCLEIRGAEEINHVMIPTTPRTRG